MIDHATNETNEQQFTSALLSENARKLYENVKAYLAYKNTKGTWLDDNKVSRSSRLTLPKLHFAQSELSRSGLMILIPGESQTQYILPDESGAESHE